MRNLLRKIYFGHLFNSFSLNSRAIHLKCTKNLSQNDFLSLRVSFSDRLLVILLNGSVAVETIHTWPLIINVNVKQLQPKAP